jgi:hypothetical protein
MKKLLTLAALVGATTVSFAQGTVNFANGSTSLISAGGAAAPLSGVVPINYALFLAPSTTVSAVGQASTFTDPVFQTPNGAGTVNSATAVGRLLGVNGYVTTATGTADFLVRGWSANAGATWAAALAFYANGNPTADMWIGQSLIGNDIVLGGGATPATTLFGAGATQVGGFNMTFVPAIPEPSSMVLAGLGAASLLLFRRRK